MKNLPMSVWLTWANRAAAIWMQTAVTVANQQQAAMLAALQRPPAGRPRTATRRKRPLRD